MSEDNSNNLAAQVAALLAKAATADELQQTVEELRRALRAEVGRGDAHLRNTEWWRKRNAELHDELSAAKTASRNAMRDWGKQKVDYIHEVARLKRELEELHAKRGALLRVAGAQAVEIASLKVALEDANLPTPPCNDEWDAWSDEAIDALKQQLKDNEPSSNYS